MAIVLSGPTNDITVNGVSVATDAEVNAALWLKANTADLKEIGVGQTWQDVTASRVAGTTYTNSTGKPIQISISTLNNSAINYTIYLYINGAIMAKWQNVFNGDIIVPITAIIPNGATYKITASHVAEIQIWSELR